MVVIACACGRGPESDLHQHEESLQQEETHQHEDAASQSTLFSDNTEFFIEHEPLEQGKESEFWVHVTQLQTYEACLVGSLTILMDGVSAVSHEPERPGIFHVPFVPRRTGEFSVRYTLHSGTITESVTNHVHVYKNLQDEFDHAEDAVADGEVIFLKEQAWKSVFMIKEVLPAPFSSVISTSGEILAMPGEKKNVSANSSGIVVFNDKTLVQGSGVKKGQHLFTLTSNTLIENNIELQYQELLNNFIKSRSEYERHQDLYAKQVVPERQFIESKSKFTNDSLRFYTLAANLTKEGLKVTAPVSGYIHELNISEGQYVETGQLLVTISSNKVLLLRADVPQQFYDLLKEIETANFRPAYTDQTYSIEDLNGRLLAKGSSVAENDHYIPVYFEVKNDGSLLEGAYAEFFLKTTSKANSLTVPVSAISEEQGAHYLYVQVTGESFTKRAVSPGDNDGRKVEIIEGLFPGERIVTEGVMLLKAASTVTSVAGHGHAH